MQKLYDGSGHIKIDMIEKALRRAKLKGKLPNFPSSKIKYFMDSLRKEIEESKLKVGNKINKNEMEYLFKGLMREDYDKITDNELKIIENILLDEDFEVY